MATKALRPCKRVGCTSLTRTGYCEQHTPDWRNRQHKSSNAWRWLYRTREWRQARELQLLMEPFCRECARYGVRTRATDVDHIKPHRGNRALFTDAGNLQSLCHSCHSRKTMRELQATMTAQNGKR